MKYIRYLSPLEYSIWAKILVVSRVLDVGLNPADVLTSPVTPFTQTLYSNTSRLSLHLKTSVMLNQRQ